MHGSKRNAQNTDVRMQAKRWEEKEDQRYNNYLNYLSIQQY